MLVLIMTKIWLISFLVLMPKISSSSEDPSQALDLYSNEYQSIKSLYSSCDNLLDPFRSVPIMQIPPTYPRRALEEGIGGTVLTKIKINADGTVKTSEVVWASADSPKYKGIFNKNTINATNKFIYKPKVNEIGENIESTAHTIIAYSIVGLEETLYLGNQTRNYKKLKRLMKKDPDRFFKEVENLLNDNKLEPIQRAIYLFFKGLMMHKQGDNKDEVIKILQESQKLYYEVYEYQTDDKNEKNIFLMGSNESKLHTFVGVLLGQLYLEKSMWNEAAIQYATVIRNVRNDKNESPRFLQSYINLGIATYSLNLWCQADESWQAAINLGAKINTKFPDWLNVYKEEANKRRN